VASGVRPQDLAAEADSVSFCLSKGLAAPVGSVICGQKDFIKKARRARKVVGGGMRQAGILAAAGIVALNEMVDRLAQDHANAKQLATGLAEIPDLIVDPDHIHTNIIYFEVNREGMTPQEFVQQLDAAGVRMLPLGLQKVRAVTHYHITSEDIDQALAVISRVMKYDTA
jgi:threonine aldolase